MSSLCPYCEVDIELPDNEFYITCESCKAGISLDGSGNVILEVEAPEQEASEEETPKEELASEEVEGDLEPEEAAEIDTSSEHENLASESLSHLEATDEPELSEKAESFSAEAMALDFNESCLYDLMISSIDSLEMQESLIGIFQEERLRLEIETIAEQFKNNISGRVSLKDLNALKLSCIVQNIYNQAIPVKLYWQQKTIE